MSKTLQIFAPDLRRRVKDIADRTGSSMSEVAKELLEPEVDRIEREWARIERQIDQVPSLSTDELEAEENRMLDIRRRSEAEEEYLDAVQAELSKRTRPAAV